MLRTHHYHVLISPYMGCFQSSPVSSVLIPHELQVHPANLRFEILTVFKVTYIIFNESSITFMKNNIGHLRITIHLKCIDVSPPIRGICPKCEKIDIILSKSSIETYKYLVNHQLGRTLTLTLF